MYFYIICIIWLLCYLKFHKYVRGKLSELYSSDIANGMRILYGGSMKPENVGGLIVQPDIDGGLIGGASLKVESFAAIIETITETQK